ncbi:MAG TPA: CTP synthase (glutamine hydrolyzing) [candidate division Zixibacteria bacterium]|nr:CTP synthase (glutamine hydrolyzing) [candidate division Zixibacteria bacterium]
MPTKTKFIVVTGGVLSGLGKGITTASIGHLLGSKLRIVPIKCDGYLNTDPGTMNPIEHGEVFVLDDGGEVDMDFGHYERFIGVNCKFEWNLTMGKVYQAILDRERRGDFLGKTVQLIPHVTDEIKSRFLHIAEIERADICLVEIGGTVGDMENELYLEAVRQLAHELGKQNTLFVHVTYVPFPQNVREQKSKPTQQSVKLLNERGIFPDVIIGRSESPLDPSIKAKIAGFCNVPAEAVISGVDVDTVYEVPLIYDEDGLTEILHKNLGIYSPPKFTVWRKLVDKIKHPSREVNIAICGKYTQLRDSYASIIEALIHAGAENDARVNISWIETTAIEDRKITAEKALEGIHGVIVPGGFGTRGIEGKIEVIRHCRENAVPLLGICYGMQLAVVEFARNVCKIESAGTAEVVEDGGECEAQVVCYLPGQGNIDRKGGTMRLGGQDVLLKAGSRAEKLYGTTKIRERFRHRYEVNPDFVEQLEAEGLIFSGTTPDGSIMQVLELAEHPFFFGTQYHPELVSRLERPAPLFRELVRKALEGAE